MAKYSDQDEIRDQQVMRDADAKHLAGALGRGDRHEAKGFVDSVIDASRRIEDLQQRLR